MTEPLEGIRVVELSAYAFVPAAGATLADWGADVIRIEQPGVGDPMRGLELAGIPAGARGFTFMWELANRGKRALALDVASDEGREILFELVGGADVFLTSLLPGTRDRLGVGPEIMRERFPSLVYARGSGHGPRGPEADRPGFDAVSYWYRSGAASAVTATDARSTTELPVPGFGDVVGGALLAGGVAAALFRRSQTGEGGVVDGSLLGTGLWAMQAGIVASALHELDEFRWPPRVEARNPLVNTFATADGRFLFLCFIESQRYWVDLCKAIGEPDLADDDRFATAELRAVNTAECSAALDAAFAQHPMEYWSQALAGKDFPWEVVRRAGEAARDTQAWDNGYLQRVVYDDGRDLTLVASPVQFDEASAEMGPAPDRGAHTDEILTEQGITAERLDDLRARGVIE